MAVQFFITRKYDRHLNETGLEISKADWRALVENTPDLKLDTEDAVARNPVTGEEIRIRATPNDVSFLGEDGEWLPFGRLTHGEVAIHGPIGFYEDDNPFRAKVAAIAKALDAIVMCDASDEIFDW